MILTVSGLSLTDYVCKHTAYYRCYCKLFRVVEHWSRSILILLQVFKMMVTALAQYLTNCSENFDKIFTGTFSENL